ncbi:hypothetical protein O3P69_014191 [Scylla paramamosain]|uniref:Uncharacterized protein n=1 Tax=Scylla paramamosain TaxID=85552 RepID=A0AAW0SAW2_SCYPA
MQGDRGTSTTTATTDDEVLSPPKPEQPAQQSAQPEPVAGPSTPGPSTIRCISDCFSDGNPVIARDGDCSCPSSTDYVVGNSCGTNCCKLCKPDFACCAEGGRCYTDACPSGLMLAETGTCNDVNNCHCCVPPSTSARRPLSISGIEQELEITVSTIIESEDSDVLGSDDAGDRGTSTTTATTDDEVLSPPKPEQPAQQSAQPEPVAGPSTPGPSKANKATGLGLKINEHVS